MKPYDLIIALRLSLATEEERQRPTSWLAESLRLSTSRIHESLQRLHRVRIVDPSGNRVVSSSLLEFIEHGVRYVFPAELGPVTRGIATASSAPPLDAMFATTADETRFVWPSGAGSVRGTSVTALHKLVPEIALRDPRMHELLALLDGARLDDQRVRREAITMLRTQLSGAT